VDVVVMWLFFAASAKSFSRFTATERGQRILNLLFGTLFIFVAALLVFIH
jgi:homoserine/homoserine lactone efflux protein